ncbi:MAG: hypothetical protein Q4C52_04800 [Eubacteriales bacterium]|nr:hypothetical protein [Eubacteriales bacterium]
MENMSNFMGTASIGHNAGNQPGGDPAGRTFTQEEVNEIVQKRLAKEREKLSKVFQEEKQLSELEEREQKLEQRELRAGAADELKRLGYPEGLTELLDYSNQENFQKSLATVTSVFGSALWERRRIDARQSTPLESYYRAPEQPKPGSENDPIARSFGLY